LRRSATEEVSHERVADSELARRVRELEQEHAARWSVRSLRTFYPPLLAARVRLRRAHDLLLCHAILRDTAVLSAALAPSPLWLRSDDVDEGETPPGLFEGSVRNPADGFEEVSEQWRAQLTALDTAP